MKKLFFFIFIFSIATKISAQSENKDVTITTSGSGLTLEEAQQSALRSAIEQSFGTFISSKTEILNDQVVADQMASVSSGNIKSFEILNQDQLPNGRWGVTLKAIVSIDKLTSFVQSKGITAELKGGLFAVNIKQQLLNEQNEVNLIAEMVGLLHEPMQISFDYTIKNGEPIALDAESKNWEIPIEVTATVNKNMQFCANYCISTLSAISLKSEEVESYKKLNKPVYPVTIFFKNVIRKFYLRKEQSISLLTTLTGQWEFYTSSFVVKNGLTELNGFKRSMIHKFDGSDYKSKPLDSDNRDGYDQDSKISKMDKNYYSGGIIINFLEPGNLAETFSISDKQTLSEIEKMTGYTVNSRGVISFFKNGGIVLIENNGTGVVLSLLNQGLARSYEASKLCENLFLNGYSDWRLPTLPELEFIYDNLFQKGIGNFHSYKDHPYYSNNGFTKYYSSYRDQWGKYYGVDFMRGDKDAMIRYFGFVRAVRFFNNNDSTLLNMPTNNLPQVQNNNDVKLNNDLFSFLKSEKENSVTISKSGNSVKVSVYELSSFGSLSIELENSKIYQGKFIRESSPYLFEFKDSTGMIFTINTNDILRITAN